MAMYQQSNEANGKAKKVQLFSVETTTGDHYVTPNYAWHWIKDVIPCKNIYDPFYCDGKSGQIFKDMGFNVYHKQEDFFLNSPKNWEEQKEDYCIVSNPPYSIMGKVFKELKKRDRPFIMLVTIQKTATKYFRDTFKNGECSIVYPPAPIKFVYKGAKKHSNIPNVCYVCYKVPNIPYKFYMLPDLNKKDDDARKAEDKKYAPKSTRVICKHCDTEVASSYLTKHYLTIKCIKIKKEREQQKREIQQ